MVLQDVPTLNAGVGWLISFQILQCVGLKPWMTRRKALARMSTFKEEGMDCELVGLSTTLQ